MRCLTPATSESREAWISARIEHMLTCRHTLDELADEIMADGSPLRQPMALATQALHRHPRPTDPGHACALLALAEIFQSQAATRAAGEWDRLFRADHSTPIHPSSEVSPC
jgi:hypothetical protein